MDSGKDSSELPQPDDQFARRLASVHQAIVEAGQVIRQDNSAIGQSASQHCDHPDQSGQSDGPNDLMHPLGDLLALIEHVRRTTSTHPSLEPISIESGEETPRALVETAGNPIDDTPRDVEANEGVSSSPIDAQIEVLDRKWAQSPVRLGRFDSLAPLGQGGFGMVYSAMDQKLERRVAIKIPRPEAMLSPALRRRFLREGRAAAALSHPNIVTIYEAGQEGPICYLASELVHGCNLVDWVCGRELIRWRLHGSWKKLPRQSSTPTVAAFYIAISNRPIS